jgi:hypothetical protein
MMVPATVSVIFTIAVVIALLIGLIYMTVIMNKIAASFGTEMEQLPSQQSVAPEK